jgi:hypothetical protein
MLCGHTAVVMDTALLLRTRGISQQPQTAVLRTSANLGSMQPCSMLLHWLCLPIMRSIRVGSRLAATALLLLLLLQEAQSRKRSAQPSPAAGQETHATSK